MMKTRDYYEIESEISLLRTKIDRLELEEDKNSVARIILVGMIEHMADLSDRLKELKKCFKED